MFIIYNNHKLGSFVRYNLGIIISLQCLLFSIIDIIYIHILVPTGLVYIMTELFIAL